MRVTQPRRCPRQFPLVMVAAVVLFAAACSGGAAGPADTSQAGAVTSSAADDTAAADPTSTAAAATTPSSTSMGAAANPTDYTAAFDAQDENADEGASGATLITLAGTSASVDGSGAVVQGARVMVVAAGTYLLTGALDDGQVVVDAGSDDTVRVVLAGVDVTSSTTAPLYVVQAGRVILTLAAGTDNRLTDGPTYVYPDTATTEPNAAVFSNDDLTVNGTGSLTVVANYNDGIASDDDLKIVGGTITVDAADDGLRGRDSVVIGGGMITITSGGDGIKASNEDDSAQGYIVVEGGTLTVTSAGDGFQAVTGLVVTGGNLTVTAGGGAGVLAGSSAGSTKGLKAGIALVITGGAFQIDATDDALHSNGSVTIAAGAFLLTTSDDGIHADESVTIEAGEITITASYEGVEGGEITIDGGIIHLTATDDGINTVAAGTTAADQGLGGGPGGPGGPGGQGGGSSPLYVNGGHVCVDAMGDGIDANGPIEMTGGTLVINGPTANNNGALDFTQFTISGGFLVAVGSSGMAQAPSTSSPQASAGLAFRSTVAADTMIHIETVDGTEVLTFVPTKEFSSVVLSSPNLEVGGTYVVYTGGSSTGTAADGLYTGGTYTPGTEAGTFTLGS